MQDSSKLRVIAMIPARYEASRFPGKLMQDLNGQTVIATTYKAAKSTGLFDEVYVVTDDDRIYDWSFRSNFLHFVQLF